MQSIAYSSFIRLLSEAEERQEEIMKWLSLIITILEYVIPALAKRGKDKLAQELTIAKETILILSKDMSPQDKGYAVEIAVGNLKAVKDFKKRVVKKLDKAKDRLYKKLF